MAQTSIKLQRVSAIGTYIENMVATLEKRADQTKDWDLKDKIRSRCRLYRSFSFRAYTLAITLTYQSSRKFGDPPSLQISPTRYLASVKERKDRGLIRFQTLHTYSTWFFGTGLHQDYGSYECDRCSRTFFHSPSRIYKAKQLIHRCACGECVNEIIVPDYKCAPIFQ